MSLYDSDSASTQELASAFSSLTFAPAPNDLDRQNAARNLTMSRPTPSTNIHLQSAFTMYPFMFQPSLASSMSYALERLPGTAQIGPMTPVSPAYPAMSSLYQTPPSPASTSQTNQSPSRPTPGYGRLDARRQNAMRISRSPHHSAAGHHNHVDIQRIRDGIDVRTTVSLVFWYSC